LATRRELIEAIAARYQCGTRIEKQKILDEFIEVTKFHRKHAIRALRKVEAKVEITQASRARLYDEAAVTALTTLWEASDRICGKRLKEAIPTLVDAMERYKHLQLDSEVRQRLLRMSAATMDRLLKPIREVAKQGRRRRTINSALRKSISVRTFSCWSDLRGSMARRFQSGHLHAQSPFPSGSRDEMYELNEMIPLASKLFWFISSVRTASHH